MTISTTEAAQARSGKRYLFPSPLPTQLSISQAAAAINIPAVFITTNRQQSCLNVLCHLDTLALIKRAAGKDDVEEQARKRRFMQELGLREVPEYGTGVFSGS